jgi:hypothetical protein
MKSNQAAANIVLAIMPPIKTNFHFWLLMKNIILTFGIQTSGGTSQVLGRCGAIRRHIGSPDCMRRCGLERLTSAHLRDFSAARSFATPAPKPRKSGDPLAVRLKDDTNN